MRSIFLSLLKDPVWCRMETVSKAPGSVSARISGVASFRLHRRRSVSLFRLEYGLPNRADTGVDPIYVLIQLAMGVLAVSALRSCIQGIVGPLLSQALPPLRLTNVGGIVG